jgi:hypothetical protein
MSAAAHAAAASQQGNKSRLDGTPQYPAMAYEIVQRPQQEEGGGTAAHNSQDGTHSENPDIIWHCMV